MNVLLSWLAAYAETLNIINLDSHVSKVKTKQVDNLMQSAARLDLSVQAAFEKLLRKPFLYRTVPFSCSWYFDLHIHY